MNLQSSCTRIPFHVNMEMLTSCRRSSCLYPFLLLCVLDSLTCHWDAKYNETTWFFSWVTALKSVGSAVTTELLLAQKPLRLRLSIFRCLHLPGICTLLFRAEIIQWMFSCFRIIFQWINITSSVYFVHRLKDLYKTTFKQIYMYIFVCNRYYNSISTIMNSMRSSCEAEVKVFAKDRVSFVLCYPDDSRRFLLCSGDLCPDSFSVSKSFLFFGWNSFCFRIARSSHSTDNWSAT